MTFNYKKIIYYTLWIIGLAVIQSTLLQYAAILGVIPNLFVVFVVCAAIMSGSPMESAGIGLILGFLMDFMIGRIIGVNMLLLMYAGVFNGLLFQRILTGKFLGVFATVFVTSLVCAFLYYSMNFMMWGQGDLGYAFVWVMLIESAYSAIIAVPFYWLVKKGYRKNYV